MALVEMVMPKMGESVMEGTILKWLKAIGDTIEQDEPVLEVATDKVDTEIPAIQGGILKEILAQEGDVVQIGKAIAIIATDGDELSNDSPANTQSQAAPSDDNEEKEEAPVLAEALQSIEHSLDQAQSFVSNGAERLSVPAQGRFYSPLVMNIAKTEGISMEELSYIPGSGLEDRVTKKDILNYLAQRKQGNTPTPAPTPTQEAPKPDTKTNTTATTTPAPNTEVSRPASSINGNVEIIEMDRMRRMIAERMVDSKRTSPHVTTFIEVDVTNIVRWRNKVKADFKKKEGENLTFTPIFMEAIIKALKDFPMINISVEGDKIIRKKEINIGMATALPSGNLIVPVIHNADHLSLVGLSKKVNELANRARQNKLKPDELSGGTYTVSNIGSFGNEMGTPIIVQPQVAIMAIGTIKKKPAVIETEEGDMIGIRHLMFISHSYDHRVVDGALGGMFGRRVADYLEAFDPNRSI